MPRVIPGVVPRHVPGFKRIVWHPDPDLAVVTRSAGPSFPLHQRAGALPLDPEAISQFVVGEPCHRIQGSAPRWPPGLSLVRCRLVRRVGSGGLRRVMSWIMRRGGQRPVNQPTTV
jgi:hypothetical protein